MSSCERAQSALAHDDGELSVADRAWLDAHVATCDACRREAADQRAVAAALRARPAMPPSPAFIATLALRLDESSGWFGMADWKTWTIRLAPVAAALALVAFLTAAQTGTSTSSVTLDQWTYSVVEPTSTAAMLWDQQVSADSLLESMLADDDSANTGGQDVR
jgi:anti-sigma factor RsiW